MSKVKPPLNLQGEVGLPPIKLGTKPIEWGSDSLWNSTVLYKWAILQTDYSSISLHLQRS